MVCKSFVHCFGFSLPRVLLSMQELEHSSRAPSAGGISESFQVWFHSHSHFPSCKFVLDHFHISLRICWTNITMFGFFLKVHLFMSIFLTFFLALKLSARNRSIFVYCLLFNIIFPILFLTIGILWVFFFLNVELHGVKKWTYFSILTLCRHL